MKQVPSLRPLDCAARAVFGSVLVVAAIFLFHDPFARLFVGLFGGWCLIEAATGTCSIHKRFRARSFSELINKEPLMPLFLIQLLLAYVWWESGWSKMTSPGYVSGFAGTLNVFAAKNPFPWMKTQLLTTYVPNAATLAPLVAWGEIVAAVVLVLSVVMYVWLRLAHVRFTMLVLSSMALIGVLFLNGLFYFAAGWTGPGTKSVNVVMFGVQLVLLYAYVSTLSEDRVSKG